MRKCYWVNQKGLFCPSMNSQLKKKIKKGVTEHLKGLKMKSVSINCSYFKYHKPESKHTGKWR